MSKSTSSSSSESNSSSSTAGALVPLPDYLRHPLSVSNISKMVPWQSLKGRDPLLNSGRSWKALSSPLQCRSPHPPLNEPRDLLLDHHLHLHHPLASISAPPSKPTPPLPSVAAQSSSLVPTTPTATIPATITKNSYKSPSPWLQSKEMRRRQEKWKEKGEIKKEGVEFLWVLEKTEEESSEKKKKGEEEF